MVAPTRKNDEGRERDFLTVLGPKIQLIFSEVLAPRVNTFHFIVYTNADISTMDLTTIFIF